jgi:AmiR/NasT family two-component response regulator
VLVANEAGRLRASLVATIDLCGYEALTADLEPAGAAAVVNDSAPALVLVVADTSYGAALHVIEAVAHQTRCPVVALSRQRKPGFARLAAAHGCYGVTGPEPEALEAALQCAYHRHSDYLGLLDAFTRRAEIEQAKGLLMAAHKIEAGPAFEMLRRHSQRTNRKVADVARALVRSHTLLLYGDVSRPRGQDDLIDALIPTVSELAAPDPHPGASPK